MAVWITFFQLLLLLGGKKVCLMEALLVLNDNLIQTPFCVRTSRPFWDTFFYYLKVHIQVNRLGRYRLSFPLSCFRNWRIPPEKPRDNLLTYFALISLSLQSCGCSPKARRMPWSSFESLRNVPLRKTEIAGQQPASIPVLNYHHTRWFSALDLYHSNTRRQDVRTGEGPGRTKVLQGDILPRCWGAMRPLALILLPCPDAHKHKELRCSLCCMFPWWGNNFMGGLYGFMLREAFPYYGPHKPLFI